MSFASSKDSLFSPIFRFKISRNLVFSPGTKKKWNPNPWYVHLLSPNNFSQGCFTDGRWLLLFFRIVWNRQRGFSLKKTFSKSSFYWWLLESTQFSPTSDVHAHHGPLIRQEVHYLSKARTGGRVMLSLIKVVMASSPRQGGTKLEWPTPIR
jgi:hypothetical protein